MKASEKDIKINGKDELLKRVDNLINNQPIKSFFLEMFDFNLEQFNLNYSSHIKLIRLIYSNLRDLLDDKIELFYFEEGKFLISYCRKNETFYKKIEIADILKGIEELDNKEIKLSSFKREVVQWPEESDDFDGLLKLLENKIHQQNNIRFPSNPNSIIINRKEDYLDKVEKRSTQLFLIAKNKNIEVIKQHILADKTFQISAGSKGSFELFYILEGTISSEDGEITLRAGDSITTKSGEEERYFKTLSEINLLYLSSTSIFSSEQKRIKELLDLNEKIADIDSATHEHCDRLQVLSQMTAEELDLEKEKIFNLGYASFLHDIGKAKIPASLLQKPGKLTEKEWEIMKKHAKWGKEILLEHFNNKYFKKVAEIIYQHHERFDGSGYPQGLKEDEILIEAQILTVVDAYDAMVFERPYQRALSREEALAEIKSEKGKQFAPQAVVAFLKAEKKFVKKG